LTRYLNAKRSARRSRCHSVDSRVPSKYRVTCVYVGPTERQTYGRTVSGLDGFRLFMDVAYQDGTVTIYRTRDRAGRSGSWPALFRAPDQRRDENDASIE
jgi:hypothetical protein